MGPNKLSLNDLKNLMGFMQEDNGLNSNFHNFFTNDRIFGSPSPPIDPSMFQGEAGNFMGGNAGSNNIKVENHYNQHTTINNYDFNSQKFYNIN